VVANFGSERQVRAVDSNGTAGGSAQPVVNSDAGVALLGLVLGVVFLKTGGTNELSAKSSKIGAHVGSFGLFAKAKVNC
jgi:hypothetical protein